jgi:hypothetical protein
MADNPRRPPSPLPAAFRPAFNVEASSSAPHGTKTTMNSQHFVMPVKLEFNVPATQQVFNNNESYLLAATGFVNSRSPEGRL